MFSIFLAAQFVSIVMDDPITLERRAAYAAEDDGNVFGLFCQPDRSEVEIHLIPRRYYAPPLLKPFLWSPRADSRFGGQAEADRDSWYFDRKSIVYTGSGSFHGNRKKAEFIDRLARDRTINIRFEDTPDRTETITIHYQLDAAEIRRFLARCNPKRVNAYLKSMNSIASPDYRGTTEHPSRIDHHGGEARHRKNEAPQ